MAKCKCPPVGAPEWVLTYGDMMSLLLTFFILLAALSELKKEEQYTKIVHEIQATFGMPIGKGLSPFPMIDSRNSQNRPKTTSSDRQSQESADDPGMKGHDEKVRTIRPGMIFPDGVTLTFEPGSSKLGPGAQEALHEVAKRFGGLTNMIELRGHASPMEQAVLPTGKDLWQLSFDRAKVVMEFLTSVEVGMPAARFRITALGDRDPLARRVYTPADQEINRRVEVLMSEDIIDDDITVSPSLP